VIQDSFKKELSVTPKLHFVKKAYTQKLSVVMYLSKTKMNLKEHTILRMNRKTIRKESNPLNLNKAQNKKSLQIKKTYLTGEQELAVYISGFH